MEGVRVLEVAQWTFVPSSGALLADWGADVIKIEHAVSGDAMRGIRNLGLTAANTDLAFSPILEHANHGKRSVGLALEHPDALDALYRIAATSDVFVTNFLPEARRRLKIDVDDIRAVNPRIVYVRGSAHGARGPDAELGGYDNCTYWARSGSAVGVTPPGTDGLCFMPGPAFGDASGGMNIAGGIAAALFARERTGEGSVIDVSLLSTGVWANSLAIDVALLTGEPWVWPSLEQPGMPTNPLVGAFLTSDDRYLVLNMMQPGRYWADFCRHVGREDLVTDPRFDSTENVMANAEAGAAILQDEIRKRPFAEWIERFRSLEGQWSPALTSVDAGRDPQVRAAEMVRPVIDADGVERELVVNPVQFDERPPDLVRAPQFAEHTDEVLLGVGYSDDEILQLKVDGAAT
ncbi:MAG TPA: CoA transferase [Acidimicrobiia bacterium]|nr:CoA transferase [Acidimicrobiia bacterium]